MTNRPTVLKTNGSVLNLPRTRRWQPLDAPSASSVPHARAPSVYRVLPLPDRCNIVLVGGYPGAGVKTQVARSAKYMQERVFSVVRILTQSFFRPVSACQCPVCASFAESYGVAAQATCRYCPESLHEDALLRSVNAAILRLTSASDFVEGVGRAIIYVLGVNVMECCELMTAASGIILGQLGRRTQPLRNTLSSLEMPLVPRHW